MKNEIFQKKNKKEGSLCLEHLIHLMHDLVGHVTVWPDGVDLYAVFAFVDHPGASINCVRLPWINIRDPRVSAEDPLIISGMPSRV